MTGKEKTREEYEGHRDSDCRGDGGGAEEEGDGTIHVLIFFSDITENKRVGPPAE